MKRFSVLIMIFTIALMALVMAPALKANDAWNMKTTVTFSQPFEVPGGQMLPAGTYVFKLLDSRYDRELVQVFNSDQTHIYATFRTIPKYRAEVTEGTVMRFAESPTGVPQPLMDWFHPSVKAGHELIYR